MKTPNEKEGTEKVRARKPAKKTAKEDAGVQAIQTQTASEIAVFKLRPFLAKYKIEIITDDVIAGIETSELCQLIDIFGARSDEEFKDGNLYGSLKYLTLVLACVKLSGAGLPLKYCHLITSIEKRLTLGGKFEELFRRIKPIFYELAQSQPEVIGEHITITDNIRRLVAEAEMAEMRLRWQDSIRLRRELIQLNPAYPANHIFLSISLENIGQYAEALEAMEAAIKLPTYRVMSHNRALNLGRIVRLRELASSPALQNTPPEHPEPPACPKPPTHSEPPAHPKPPERRAETILRYEQYLTSAQQDSRDWPTETADGGGSGWRRIPEDQLDVLQKIFGAFEKKMMTAGLHKQDKASYRQLKTLLEQISRGVINEHTLLKCAEECRTGPSRSVQIIKEDALR